MGIFGRRPHDQQQQQSSSQRELQIPDRLAGEAAQFYGSAQFGRAFATYCEAIDKMHTMCVVAEPGSRIRTPGDQDRPIVDGAVNSLGAALAMDASLRLGADVDRAASYLRQIAAEVQRMNREASMYQDGALALESEWARRLDPR